MPIVELTEDQIVSLLRQMPDAERQRVLNRVHEQRPARKIPQFGIAKGAILYMSPDFDAPLEDFKEYTE
jgi:hypothetical protein